MNLGLTALPLLGLTAVPLLGLTDVPLLGLTAVPLFFSFSPTRIIGVSWGASSILGAVLLPRCSQGAPQSLPDLPQVNVHRFGVRFWKDFNNMFIDFKAPELLEQCFKDRNRHRGACLRVGALDICIYIYIFFLCDYYVLCEHFVFFYVFSYNYLCLLLLAFRSLATGVYWGVFACC